MSGRKLGGGKMLGNRKSLAPALVPDTHQKTLSPISSSTILSSQPDSILTDQNGLQDPDCLQDLSLAVSMANESCSVSRVTQLYCPICNEEMMTLLQLNRYIRMFRGVTRGPTRRSKNWFDKQVVKAKLFQPLIAINQKLKGLDVFESNAALNSAGLSPSLQSEHLRLSPEPSRSDPDEIVNRSHWQKTGYNLYCPGPTCQKRLGSVNGSVNCRKCGKLFCEYHTMYQMKLSRSASHEPVRGLWCRVCEICYKSREGYNDYSGFERDHSAQFLEKRRKKVDKANLEISRLEKRLTKLTELLAQNPEDLSESRSVLSISGQNHQRKMIEQSVVTWEEDWKVPRCPFCLRIFGTWSFRRHHCRLCGCVVCADSLTNCSSTVSLDLLAEKYQGITLDIRMCRNCHSTLFRKKDFKAEVLHKPPDQRAYENIIEFEKGIHSLLPTFQRLVISIQDPKVIPSHAQLNEASKVRKRLMDSFGKYDLAAKRIRDLPSNSPVQLKLQLAIYQQCANFLNIHMLPLKTLPKILKHASPHDSATLRSNFALDNIRKEYRDTSSQISSFSATSGVEAEERQLTEQLIIMEEQSFMLREMLIVARKARRFDELAALGESIAEMERECDRLRGLLGNLDCGNLYST
ncbi:vacuolar segregation protein [Blumeria hordei DH14]|uniref:Vacuolar segregation protein n=1 Tax=Blumeria graminis f. sp. hordei (strain DH14) TaxID=546991 RepID=N1J5E6_BLUG1|nr:vacuolar segregation protein [Blumeria hordei DH14]